MGKLKAVYQWVLRTMMKDQTGVMRTLPRKDIFDFNVQMTAERLMRGGVDPNSLKNANQVENALNMIENAPRNQTMSIGEARGSGIKSAKIMDLEGKEIDPRSRIMGGKQAETEAEILARINRENKKGIARIQTRKKMLDDAIDDASPGFSGDRKVDAELVAENLAERMGLVYDDMPTKERLKLYDQAYTGLSKQRFKNMKKPKDDVDDPGYDDEPADFDPDADNETFAKGGIARLGFKDGMTRRTFLKLLGGIAAVPIVGKFFKLAKIGQKVKQVPIIKTDDVAGKPEWFDALVNKVIAEGDDVTKKLATGERQSIHQKTLGDGSVVRVTEDVDDGAVRVEYESAENVFGDPVQLQYKKPLPDEGAPRPAAEFTTAESGPVGRSAGPDDFEIDIDEVGGTSIRDLDSDVSKLKEYATGQKPTIKELVQNIERRKKAQRISEDPEAQSDAVVARQGEALDYDDYASGGIAGMLGE